MDIPLDENYRKKQIIKNTAKASAVLAIVIAFFLVIFKVLESSISMDRIRTAVVETGDIDATINGSGTVVPEFEQVLTSPVTTTVLKILENPGAELQPGQRILELDLKEFTNSSNSLNEQITLKTNQREKLKLDFQKRELDMNSQIEIKKLNLDVLKSRAEQQDNLFKVGGTSREKLDQAKLEESIARIELDRLQRSLTLDEETHKNQLSTFDTEIKLLRQDREEIERQLKFAEIRSDRHGVLTSTITDQGANITKGEVVAKIADFTSFKIEGIISDIHASKIGLGQPVIVKIGDTTLDGKVTGIMPTITNGQVSFYVGLENKSHSELKSNLRVDVYVVTARKSNVLRVKNGPFASGEGLRDVFVLRGEKAYKIKARLGLSNFDYFEVVEGLSEGEEVIITDMSSYSDVDEIKIKR
ncbi:MAG: efflux RND transporter periplasmic adaptor subunit [bacterium]|nr:efflux RND transporter periplasmic adaptor subunit [bacterium]